VGERLTVVARDGGDHGLVAVAPATLDTLGLGPGDSVSLSGGRETVGRVTPDDAVPVDAVGLSATMRRNAGVSTDERVEVSQTTVDPARSVTLAPIQTLTIKGGESALSRTLSGSPIRVGDRVQARLLDGALTLPFRVVATDPSGPVRVTEETTVTVRDRPAEELDDIVEIPPVRYDDIGGLDAELRQVRELVELPLLRPELVGDLGRRPADGVLLYGPSGAGKSLLWHALATESDVDVLPVPPSALLGRSAESAIERLREVGREAAENAPAVVVLDDVDSVVPDDDDTTTRRLLAGVRDLMDRIARTDGVVALGTARSADDVHSSLRRGGRFDREIELGAPDRDGRRDILSIQTRGVRLADDVDLDGVAERTGGYLGADLDAIVRSATGAALSRLGGVDLLAGDAGATPGETPALTEADFDAALRAVGPSAMRSVRVEVPTVSYDDIGGLAEAKRELIRAAEWPIRHPELFDQLGVTAPKGVLLYGPPGTGKTMLARAVASATEANFIPVKGPELLDKFVGESEKAVREVFERARANAPAIVFFDEIDALTPERGDSNADAPERVVSQLLTELDGLERLSDVTVVAATNRPDRIDPALLRPGRLERLVEVPLPDEEARAAIFRVHTRDVPTTNLNFDALARETEGFTGSDIEAVIREASLSAMEEYLSAEGTDAPQLRVEARHLRQALDAARPSITQSMRQYYDGLSEKLRQ
jgi:transitional endoplasmic reticulum ATPase